MPELPEVETVMRGMIPALEDQSIRRVIINRFDLRGGIPDDFAARTEGAHVETLARRGKYILIHFDNDLSAVLHLGMSGRIRIFPRSNAYTAKKHDHVLIDTVAGARIAFEDPRRFGMLYLLPRPTWQQNAPFAAMGPEPLSSNQFNAPYLHAALARRTGPIKTVLLDQTVVAGLGNIYVCEALFRAGIRPDRPAHSLPEPETASLTRMIKDVLHDAIAAGGSTLRDYQQADGKLGYFQHSFDVYGRKDAPCNAESCCATIQHCVQAGRSTFYCPQCQL